MKSRRKKDLALLLIIILLSVTMGYALITTQLKINGSAAIAKNSWIVYWDNPVVSEGSITPTLPTLSAEQGSSNNTITTWSNTLNVPGDFYEFTIDAVNNGTIDAMISAIDPRVVDQNNNPVDLPSYIKYEVTYVDGKEIEENHLLAKKSGNTPTREKYKIRVEFLDTITNQQLNEIPEGGLSYTFSYHVSYAQADNNAIVRPKDYVQTTTSFISSSGPAFFNDLGIKKNQVEKIYTMNTVELPSDLQNGNVQSWDISSEQNGSIMAYAVDTDSNSKYEIYLGQTGGVKAPVDCGKLFYSYSNVTYMDLSNFITDDIENMNQTFSSCSKLESIDGMDNFNTSKVTNMSGMFLSCSALTSLNLSSFDTSNVTNMGSMFFNCGALTSLNLSNFDTSNVTNMSSMFSSCSGLTSLDLSNFNTNNVTDMSSMFSSCSGLKSPNLSSFNTSNVTNMSSMFSSCSGLTSLNLSNFNTNNVMDMSFMFDYCSGLTSLNLSSFNTSNVTSMLCMFNGCSGLTSLDLSNFNTNNVTSMSYMFAYCSGLTSLNLSSFNTSNVIGMSSMFLDCKALTSLNLSNFNTSQVTNMYCMFYNCKSLTSLNLSNFDTSQVTNMSYMFSDCSKLKSIDISNFDMSKVTNTFAMFNACGALQNIVMPNNYTRIEVFEFNHNSSYNQESFTIPKTVTIVGNSHIFYDFGNTNFKKFIVEEGSTTLKTIDDLLYTYDGTKLISIPNGKTFTDNTYVMPDSVTTLNTMCFNRTQKIDKVVISDNLVIDRYYDDTSSGDSDPVKGNRLNTGIYVYTSIKEYEAKSTNNNYSSYGGCIYNKAGTELIAVPVKYAGVLNIKDGTTTIGREAFWVQRVSQITNITEINIPASVTTIEAKQLTTLNKLVDKGVVINIDSNNNSYMISNNKIVAK